MEKERSTKIIAIIALLVGVVGLSLGFAAMSNTLTIKSGATVTPDTSAFNVDFSSVAAPATLAANDISATISADDIAAGVTATDATIDNANDPVIQNLHATFTKPNQSVSYTFYAYNIGKYEAFLRSITFMNVTGESSTRTCTPGEDSQGNTTNATQVAAACDDISVSVKVNNEAAVTGTKDDYSSHSLAINASEPIVVTITYAENGDVADGPFTVNFGDIKLLYSSIDRTVTP